MKARIVACAASVVAVAAVGCGGEEASVVQTAFETPVDSAQVALRLDVDQRGRSLMRMTLNGPMKSNGKDRLESFDWRVPFSARGRTLMAGRVISTGDNVFVRHGGRTYEVGEKRVAKLNRHAAGGEEIGLRDLTRMGIDLQSGSRTPAARRRTARSTAWPRGRSPAGSTSRSRSSRSRPRSSVPSCASR